MFKDHQFGQRYNQFNQFQHKINDSYNQMVARPEMEKQAKLNSIIRKNELEAKRRQEIEAINKENAKKNWNLNNRFEVERQIKDKQSGKMVGATEYEVDFNNRVNHEKNVNNVEYFEKFQKKQEQNQYKELLDNQLKISKQRKMYGNMTGVEKSLNKDDLVAWKNYNHNTYAMIPGLNSSKKPLPEKILVDKQEHKRERSYEDEFHRMNQFGFTRDVTKARNPAYVSQYVNSSRRGPDATAFSLEPKREFTGSRGQVGSITESPKPPSKVLSSEVPARSMLRSGHQKYPNHHLYSNYNPISGAFGMTEGAGNKNVFQKAGNNIFG